MGRNVGIASDVFVDAGIAGVAWGADGGLVAAGPIRWRGGEARVFGCLNNEAGEEPVLLW